MGFRHVVFHVTGGCELNKEKTGSSTNITPVAALLTFPGRSLRMDEPEKGQSGGKCGSPTFQERRPSWQKDGLIDVRRKGRGDVSHPAKWL